ncbi:TPA: hypothetical protein QDB06_000832 [Burkholderia vietnamiensis]|nr:hypothetical protein [Burkholderia vietnamiensis]
MKKIFILGTFVFASAASQACEINSITKACGERADGYVSAQVFVDGQPSSDYTTKKSFGGYMKITKLSPITKSESGYALVKLSDGTEKKVPFSVTTKDYMEGNDKIGRALPGLLKEIRGQ